MKQKFKGSYFCYIILFFSFYYCMASFGSVLPVYLTGIGIGMADLSWIVSASSLFGFVVIPLTGYLCDRTGRLRSSAAALMTGVGVFAMLFSQTRQVALLFLFNGLTMSLINSVQPVLERLAGAARYRYGLLRVWGTIGYAVGAQVAAILLQHLPPVFLFLSVLIAAGLTLPGLAGAQEPPHTLTSTTGSSSDRTSTSPTGKSSLPGRFVLFLVIAFLLRGSTVTNMTYIPVLLAQLGLNTDRIGTILFFSTLTEIPIILFSHRYMDRFSIRTLLLAAGLLTLLEFFIFGFTRCAVLAAVTVILLKAVTTTSFVMISLKAVRCLLPDRLTSTGLALVNTCGNVGAVLLQNAGGHLVEAASLPIFYQVLSGLILLVLFLSLFLKTGQEVSVFN